MTNINTVAQALRKIKEIKGKIAQVTTRMQGSICWTEPGVKPVYDYNELAKEREGLTSDLVLLKSRLAKTNALTLVEMDHPDGKCSVQEAIFILAELKAYREFLRTLTIKEGEAKAQTGEYNQMHMPIYVTVKLCSALGLRARDDLVAKLEQKIADIHEVIEAANHRTTLL